MNIYKGNQYYGLTFIHMLLTSDGVVAVIVSHEWPTFFFLGVSIFGVKALC